MNVHPKYDNLKLKLEEPENEDTTEVTERDPFNKADQIARKKKGKKAAKARRLNKVNRRR
jgi:hypothetical protein